MRVLVPFEDLRYLYRDLLVRAIRNSRPTLNVRSASLEKLAHVLLHFEPHVVVCSQPSSAHPVGSGAWVQVPTDNPSEDYDRLAQLCLDGEHWLTEGPPLSELFAVIDEAKERLDEGTADLLFTGVRGKVEFCEVRGSKVEFEVALRDIGVGLYWAPDVYRALPRPDALSPPSST